MNLREIKENLVKKGLKVTQQRLVIYQALVNVQSHPTAEDIYEKIHKKNPSISLGTVYKTLETFVQGGLIKQVNTKGKMRYDARIDHHNHIYCSNTEEIIDFDSEELSLLIEEFLRSRKFVNFDLTEVIVNITGTKIDSEKNVEIH